VPEVLAAVANEIQLFGLSQSTVALEIAAQVQELDYHGTIRRMALTARGGMSARKERKESEAVWAATPPVAAQQKAKPKPTWIEIELVDEDGAPVPGEKYEITLPDGSVKTGTLDAVGIARVERIDPGSCKVTFPNLDKDAWEPA